MTDRRKFMSWVLLLVVLVAFGIVGCGDIPELQINESVLTESETRSKEENLDVAKSLMEPLYEALEAEEVGPAKDLALDMFTIIAYVDDGAERDRALEQVNIRFRSESVARTSEESLREARSLFSSLREELGVDNVERAKVLSLEIFTILEVVESE